MHLMNFSALNEQFQITINPCQKHMLHSAVCQKLEKWRRFSFSKFSTLIWSIKLLTLKSLKKTFIL